MPVLSDMLKKGKSLSIIVSGMPTTTEALRMYAMYTHAKNLNMTINVYVLGDKYTWFSNALQQQSIEYDNTLHSNTSYVLEIANGKDKVKSVKVDIKDGKLLLYLEPKNGKITKNDTLAYFFSVTQVTLLLINTMHHPYYRFIKC